MLTQLDRCAGFVPIPPRDRRWMRRSVSWSTLIFESEHPHEAVADVLLVRVVGSV